MREPKKGKVAEPYPPKAHEHEDKMATYLQGRSLNTGIARWNGWYAIQRDGVRILMPAKSKIENHRYWQARGVEGQAKRYDSPFGPRRDALIVVSHYGEEQAMVVVEGPMDALAVAGIPGFTGIALMGASPNFEALEHLAERVVDKKVILVADRDALGAMAKIQGFLATRMIQSTLKILFDKNDIACYSKKEREEFLS